MANFTLDDFEIERPEEGFTYTTKSGRSYELADPKGLKGHQLLAFQQGQMTAEDFFTVLLGEDNFDEFMDEDEVDGYLLDPLLMKWSEHFGLALEPGKAERSNRPSTGSGKNSKQTSRTGTKGRR